MEEEDEIDMKIGRNEMNLKLARVVSINCPSVVSIPKTLDRNKNKSEINIIAKKLSVVEVPDTLNKISTAIVKDEKTESESS